MRRLIMALAAVVCVLAGPAAGIAAASPEWQVRPEISPSPGGSIQVGERLVCSAGTWKGRPSFEYAWYREGIGVSPRAKENVTYTLSKADEHEELTCIVTATENKATTEVESVNAICLGGKCNGKGPPPEPLESVPPGPTISGKAAVGEQLTCEPGKWKGSPSEFKYRWLREKEAITGAESSTYKVQERDAGHKLSCKVTAKNSTEEKSAESESVSVPGLAPKDITAPKVQGTPAVNETLICNPGTWSGSEPFTFEYQWLLNGKAIAMEFGAYYIVKPADEGQSLACEVTAKNSVGKSSPATSEAVKVSVTLKNTELPAITGTAKEGSTLKCSEGKWNETVQVAYHWLREKTGESVKEISGATTSEHKVVKEDVGSVLYCQVEAKHEAEKAVATSEPFSIPREGVPVDKKAPEVEVKGSEAGGKAIVGDTLACLHGEWSPAPTEYRYEWLREEAGHKALIREETLGAGKSSSEYVVQAGDEGYTVWCAVIAKDSEGPSATQAESNGIAVAVKLKNTELPVISGTPKEGETLKCSEGKWNESVGVTYQWLREGKAISGATTAEHKVVKEDLGSLLYCEVKAKHETEEVAAKSESFSISRVGVPVDVTAPEVKVVKGSETGGKAIVGDTLACLHGEWSPAPTEYRYQWLREEAPGKKVLIREETLGAGTSSSEYVVQAADEGDTVSCAVIAKDSEGPSATQAESNGIAVAVKLKNTELPVISGTPKEGETLKCSEGKWNESVGVTYQWLREGKAISGATTAEHKVVKEDLGSLLYCEVKAKHETEEVAATSKSFSISRVGVPVDKKAPEVEVKGSETGGKAIVGDTLACLHGEWSPAPTEYRYQWLREGTLIREETLEAGKKSSEYVVQAADEGDTVSCAVIAKDSEGPSATPAESKGIAVAVKLKNTELPVIAGTPKEGETLKCSEGKWNESVGVTYQWLREGKAISGATTAEHKIVKEDVGNLLYCEVKAKHETEEVAATSKSFSISRVGVPVDKKAPEVEVKGSETGGKAIVGDTLACLHGEWSPAPTEYRYQWLREGTLIREETLEAGKASSEYVVQAADEGATVSCAVIAKDSEGPSATQAESKGIAVAVKLKNTELPVISGTPKEGETLKCSEGKWNESVGVAYQWLREGKAISGATTAEHEVVKEDVGNLLYCEVEAKYESEKLAVRSTAFSIPGGVPVDKEAPEVEVKGSEQDGKAIGGDTLACLHGEWTPAPTQYLYEWLREETPGKKTLITSETLSAAEPSSAYIVQEADEGYTVSCAVIAKNGEGPSEPEASDNAVSVAGEIPLSIISPQITPDASPAREGDTLSCLRGTWVGEPEPTTFIYTWFREGAEKIAEGETSAYKIGKEDRGHWLSCTVTASNNQGNKAAASSNKVYVQGAEPEAPVGWPKIGGEPTVGSVLRCEADEEGWTGAPAPVLTFQWLLNGTPIPSATLSQFTVTAADRGSNLTCTVTGTNDEGTRSVTSALVHIAGEAPKVIEEPPYIVGTGAVGRTLTCERGTWAGQPAPSFTYQWYRDGSAIAGATEQKYTVELADQEHVLSCRVIATNIEGSAEAESVNSVAIVSHAAQSKVAGSKTTGNPAPPAPPSQGVILASLERQLTTVLSKARLKSVRKAGGFAFPFIPPWEGTLEVSWYQVEKVKTAHGTKRKRLVLARSQRSYTSMATSSFKLRLTPYGQRALAHHKRMKLTMEVAFAIAHDTPATWYATFVLGSAEPEVR